MMASCLSIGISKRELMEDYYLDEIGKVIAEWNVMHSPDGPEEEMNAMAFLGGGGEVVG